MRGFTLIEVLVAFSIFALCIGALFELFGGAVRRGTQAQELEIDWLTAQSVLAEWRSRPGPSEAETSGYGAAGRDWRVRALLFDAQTDPKSPWKAYDVTVRVSHDKGIHAVEVRSIELVGSVP